MGKYLRQLNPTEPISENSIMAISEESTDETFKITVGDLAVEINPIALILNEPTTQTSIGTATYNGPNTWVINNPSDYDSIKVGSSFQSDLEGSIAQAVYGKSSNIIAVSPYNEIVGGGEATFDFFDPMVVLIDDIGEARLCINTRTAAFRGMNIDVEGSTFLSPDSEIIIRGLVITLDSGDGPVGRIDLDGPTKANEGLEVTGNISVSGTTQSNIITVDNDITVGDDIYVFNDFSCLATGYTRGQNNYPVFQTANEIVGFPGYTENKMVSGNNNNGLVIYPGSISGTSIEDAIINFEYEDTNPVNVNYLLYNSSSLGSISLSLYGNITTLTSTTGSIIEDRAATAFRRPLDNSLLRITYSVKYRSDTSDLVRSPTIGLGGWSSFNSEFPDQIIFQEGHILDYADRHYNVTMSFTCVLDPAKYPSHSVFGLIISSDTSSYSAPLLRLVDLYSCIEVIGTKTLVEAPTP